MVYWGLNGEVYSDIEGTEYFYFFNTYLHS